MLAGLTAVSTGVGSMLASVGCAVVATYAAVVRDGRVVIPLAEAQARMGERGALMITGADLPESIILVQHAAGFRALGATCTHLGCTVRPGKNQLQCPCHGSSFSTTGAVLRGPAQRPLTRYAVDLTRDELIVSLAVGKG